MSVRGGKRPVRRRAVLFAALLGVLLGASGLAACEYADNGGSPSAGSSATSVAPMPTSVPIQTTDPDVVALEAENMAKVASLLDDATEGGSSFGTMGGIGRPDGLGGSGGLSSIGPFTAAGSYTITAVCVGAKDARLSAGPLGAESKLDIELSCGSPVSVQLELPAGKVFVSVFGATVTGAGPEKAAPVAGLRVRLETPSAAVPNP